MNIVEVDEVDVNDELSIRIVDEDGVLRAEYVVGEGISPLHELDMVSKVASGQVDIDEGIEKHLVKMTSGQTELTKVYLHAVGRRKIRRSAALVEMIERIQDELSKPYRIEGATTSELIRLLDVHTEELSWFLKYLQGLVKDAQVEVTEKQFAGDQSVHLHYHGEGGGGELDQPSRDRLRRMFTSFLQGVSEEGRIEDARLLDDDGEGDGQEKDQSEK